MYPQMPPEVIQGAAQLMVTFFALVVAVFTYMFSVRA
jgi:hypothetical protein